MTIKSYLWRTPVIGGAAPSFQWEATRTALGLMYLLGGLAHLVLAVRSPTIYEGFADQALLGVYTDLWRDFVVPSLAVLVPLVGLFEIAIGVFLLWRNRAVRLGHSAGALFQAGLVLSGPWGPVNAVLTLLHGLAARQQYPDSITARLRAWRRAG